jgi:DNA-binding transcriptional MerR regulator/methylmalonyl-CoA mutase cobalamin-binding subunit
VGAPTLRAWERRYGLLNPERTPKGHRLYSDLDVERVDYIVKLLQEGHSLPAIAGQLSQDASHVAGQSRQGLTELAGVWCDYVSHTLRAIEDFSSERLEAIHNEATSLYPVDMVTGQLIEPVLSELGSRWQSRETGIGEEHFYTNWVRNRLGARFLHALSQARGPRILCAGLPGDLHDIGLMLFSLSALTRGYRVLYLGCDLPPGQLAMMVTRSAARGVVLSARSAPEPALHQELADLALQLDVPMLLGGLASDRPLPVFEGAGGIRLGSRIEVALRVLASHVPTNGSGSRVRPARGV